MTHGPEGHRSAGLQINFDSWCSLVCTGIAQYTGTLHSVSTKMWLPRSQTNPPVFCQHLSAITTELPWRSNFSPSLDIPLQPKLSTAVNEIYEHWFALHFTARSESTFVSYKCTLTEWQLVLPINNPVVSNLIIHSFKWCYFCSFCSPAGLCAKLLTPNFNWEDHLS